MKYKNIKVQNISKRILTTVFALTLVTTSLTGCTKDFRYERTNINGKYVVSVSGDIDYKTAGKLKVIEINICGENMLFLARKYESAIRTKDANNKINYQYLDVFQDFKIIELIGESDENIAEIDSDNSNVKFIKEENLEKYLNEYGYNQKEYSIDELEEIFEKIEENYQFNDTKTLVKK